MAPPPRVLRFLLFLAAVFFWLDRRRRAAICASGARDVRQARLDHTDSEQCTMAEKTPSLLLAGHDRLSVLRSERLGGAAAFGD